MAATDSLANVPSWIRLYVLVLMILLPLDWFGPTGFALRELGAKPAILLMIGGGLLGLLLRSRGHRHSFELTAVTVFSALLALGFAAALINFMMGWSSWFYSRDPFVQLVSQALLVVTAGIALIGHARLIRMYPIVRLAARYLPVAATMLFGVFALEAAGLINDASSPLSLFRAADQGILEKPSGLFSEPSYYGTFAAIYGTSLLTLPAKPLKRLLYILLTLCLYASAVLVGAKTFVVVAGAQAMFFVLRHTRTLRTKLLAGMLVIVIGVCAVFFIQTYQALNVDANLSSAIRFGSTLLAANAVSAGYGLPGIGIGQFHFFFRDEFAPNFIYASWEGILQLSPDSDNRASTYNFYIRVVLELGLAGFLLLFSVLKKLWSVEVPLSATYAQFMFAGSLGFLMTQDPYFYPPLIFSAAILLSYVPAREPVHQVAARVVRADSPASV